MDPDYYQYETHFEKKAIIDLAQRIQKSLGAAKVSSGIWQVQPWELSFMLQIQWADLGDMVYPIYLMPEVVHVHLSIDLATKFPILHVSLHPKWFVQENKNAESPSRKLHPEAEGGSLA